MKFPYVLSIVAAILLVALGVTGLLLDVSVRDLRIAVAAQEGQAQGTEARMADQMQAIQSLEEQREAQEQDNEGLRRKVAQQQVALETQQEQINQATQITQQVGPNLLHDLATASLKNEKIKALLIARGFMVQAK